MMAPSLNLLSRRPLRLLVAAAVLLVASAAQAQDRDVTRHPGYVDSSNLAELADADGKLIEVNVRGKLLNVLVRRAVARRDQDIAAILGNLLSMSAVIADVGDNRQTIEHRFAECAGELEDDGWERFVRVRENETEDYAAYVHYKEGGVDDDAAVNGLVVMGFTGGEEMIFVNLVGTIDIDRIGLLTERFGMPGLDDWMPPPARRRGRVGDPRTVR